MPQNQLDPANPCAATPVLPNRPLAQHILAALNITSKLHAPALDPANPCAATPSTTTPVLIMPFS